MNLGSQLEFLHGEIAMGPKGRIRNAFEGDIEFGSVSKFLLGSLADSRLLGAEVLDPPEEL
jgi:hypothetical protein